MTVLRILDRRSPTFPTTVAKAYFRSLPRLANWPLRLAVSMVVFCQSIKRSIPQGKIVSGSNLAGCSKILCARRVQYQYTTLDIILSSSGELTVNRGRIRRSSTHERIKGNRIRREIANDQAVNAQHKVAQLQARLFLLCWQHATYKWSATCAAPQISWRAMFDAPFKYEIG